MRYHFILMSMAIMCVYIYIFVHIYIHTPSRGILGGPVVKNLPDNAEETGSIPDLGRSYILQSD